MSAEQQGLEYINSIFKLNGYLEQLPTETLHRIFFIKLTIEDPAYKISLPYNDPMDPAVIEANAVGRTGFLGALSMERPLQTIWPAEMEGDDIIEPDESIQIQAPLSVKQFLIDEQRYQDFVNNATVEMPINSNDANTLEARIYLSKWPNYSRTLNFHKPTTLPILAPNLVNQLDSIPDPVAYVQQQTGEPPGRKRTNTESSSEDAQVKRPSFHDDDDLNKARKQTTPSKDK
jgi:hypothetical protein